MTTEKKPFGYGIDWGRPKKTGYVIAIVRAGRSARRAASLGAAARVRKALEVGLPTGVRDRSSVDRYLVLELPEETPNALRGAPIGPRRWYTPRINDKVTISP